MNNKFETTSKEVIVENHNSPYRMLLFRARLEPMITTRPFRFVAIKASVLVLIMISASRTTLNAKLCNWDDFWRTVCDRVVETLNCVRGGWQVSPTSLTGHACEDRRRREIQITFCSSCGSRMSERTDRASQLLSGVTRRRLYLGRSPTSSSSSGFFRLALVIELSPFARPGLKPKASGRTWWHVARRKQFRWKGRPRLWILRFVLRHLMFGFCWNVIYDIWSLFQRRM